MATELVHLEQERKDKAIQQLLTSASSMVDWDEQQEQLVISRLPDATIETADFDSLYLLPSYFAIPHCWVGAGSSLSMSAEVPTALGQRAALDTTALAVPLKALAGPIRLRMIALLMESSRSTQELAGILHLSAPAVSRNLKKLADVGIVARTGRTKRGMYVKYEINRNAARELVDQMAALIGADLGGPSGDSD